MTQPAIDILDVIGSDTQLRKVANTNGGELAGSCPFCGGKDRFRVQPSKGQWWCRQCSPDERWHSAADYIMKRDSISFPEAAQRLGIGTDRPRAEPDTWDYHNAEGQLIYQVVRFVKQGEKSYAQRVPHGSEWTWGLNGTAPTIYHLPEVLQAAAAGATIYIAEGEKCADALRRLGLVATTNSGGAGKWRETHSQALAGAGDAVIFADNDEPGRKHAAAVLASVKPLVPTARVVAFPELGEKGDVADWLSQGHTKDELLARCVVPVVAPESIDPPTAPEADESPAAPIGPAVEVPPLPAVAQLDPALSQNACPWLDDYVAFSERWAPRAYAGFHRAVGLWLLSTVAARRVRLSMGGERFPSLYISLCARTSLFTKSTVAKVAIETLRAAGLSHLLAADDATPQAFIRAMTRKLPADYKDRDEAGKARAVRRLAFAAQRGWWYEEFGQKVAAMMKDGGFMADFRGILRRFDDCPDRFEYSSILRGDDVVEQPYLSLLTNLTPADLKPYAGKGAPLWGDGFWARFAFVTPPPDAQRPRGRWPVGAMQIPRDLYEPLRRWHEALGIPDVSVDETTDKNDVVVHAEVTVSELTTTDCLLGPGVFEAFYTYLDALLDLAAAMPSQDFDGNYARLPEKALRVAMLAASLENDNRIELRHWALGQEVAEQWRAELHNLAASLQGDVQESRTSDVEQRVQATIKRLGKATVNDLRRHVRGLSVEEIERSCEALVRIGVVLSEQTIKGTKRYTTAEPTIVDIVDSRHRRHNPKTSTIAPDEGSGDAPDRVPLDNRRHFLDASTVYPVYDVYDSSDIQDNVSLEKIEDGVYIEETDQGYEVVDYINQQRFLVSAHAEPTAAQDASTVYLSTKERKARYTAPEGY